MFDAHEPFKKTLQEISKVLNNNGIEWCLGSSSSLYVQGVEVTPKDLDIIVNINQFDKVFELLDKFKPADREEGVFAGEKYYKSEFQETIFPAEIAGFDLNTSTLVKHDWQGISLVVHPLDIELEMYKKRPGKEHVVALIEDALKKVK